MSVSKNSTYICYLILVTSSQLFMQN